jgi:para-nitrobenzyl esterase
LKSFIVRCQIQHHNYLIAILFTLLLLGCIGTPSDFPGLSKKAIVHTFQGPVQGFQSENGAYGWLGIPYAMPPINELRWKPPRRVASWDQTLKTNRIPDFCTQYAGPMVQASFLASGKILGSEDCLYLNIWAPESFSQVSGNERFPVMVWIHGGGNSVGHGSNYYGQVLANKFGVIVVTFNYRLGPFGWFAHPALQSVTTDGHMNFGLLDQVALLEWVRENIKNFGGNPLNITLFGESAGGRNILALLASNKARGLFQKAIVQSGIADTIPYQEALTYKANGGHKNSSKEILLKMLIAQGLTKTPGEAKSRLESLSDSQVRRLLYSLSAPELLSVYEPSSIGMINFPSNIAGDGLLENGELLDLLAKADPKVPVLIGTNRDEMKTFLLLNDRYVRNYFRLYFQVRNKNLYEFAAKTKSLRWRVIGSDEPSIALSSAGVPVYRYSFDFDDHPSILGLDLQYLLGAAHGIELEFVFGRFDLDVGFNLLWSGSNKGLREALAYKVGSYWTQFAKAGAPGSGFYGEQVNWPKGPDSFLILDSEIDLGVRVADGLFTGKELHEYFEKNVKLLSEEEQCLQYAELFWGTKHYNPAFYDAISNGHCKSIDPKKSAGF